MCNDYEREITWAAYREAMRAVSLEVPSAQTSTELPPAADVRIRDMAPVIRAAGNGVELAQMRWSWPSPRGKPVFNFVSEGRRFGESKRCLIPASAFFEFTGRSYPKAKHRFTLAGAPFMCIAGLWRPMNDEADAFTMLTTPPGPDVAPFHDRQVAVLHPNEWADWIFLARPEAELLRPLPAGSLRVQTVRAAAKSTAGD